MTPAKLQIRTFVKVYPVGFIPQGALFLARKDITKENFSLAIVYLGSKESCVSNDLLVFPLRRNVIQCKFIRGFSTGDIKYVSLIQLYMVLLFLPVSQCT